MTNAGLSAAGGVSQGRQGNALSDEGHPTVGPLVALGAIVVLVTKRFDLFNLVIWGMSSSVGPRHERTNVAWRMIGL